MLDDIVDAFSELMDFVDRGVASIIKTPSLPSKPRSFTYGPPPPYSYHPPNTSTGRTTKATQKWSTRLSSSVTSTSNRSNQYLPKRIPFQKKSKIPLQRKVLPSKPSTLAPKAKVAQQIRTTNTTSPAKPKAEAPERPKAVRAPSSNLWKVPTSPSQKRNGLISSEIQCDASRCDILVIAIADLETCKEVFGGRSAQFNLVEAKRKDKFEQGIVVAVDKLDKDTTSALHSSYAILSSYRALTRLMDKRLDDISRSPSGGGDLFAGAAGAELRRLSSSVKAHSTVLSERVRKIQDSLRALVHDIEKTKEKAASKALRRKIWRWFVRIFRALSVLISVGGTIFTLVNPVGLIGSISIAATSTLAAAVAKLCELVENKFSETTFDSILRLLRSQMPEAAKAAELSLTSFQACHRILQLELQVRSGKRDAWVGSREAQRAHGTWKDAEQRLKAINR